MTLLFPAQSLRTAIQHHMIPLIQLHIPSRQIGTEGMRAICATFASVGIDHRVTDRTEIVLRLSGDEIAGLELERA